MSIATPIPEGYEEQTGAGAESRTPIRTRGSAPTLPAPRPVAVPEPDQVTDVTPAPEAEETKAAVLPTTPFARTTPPERFEPAAAIPLAEADSLVPQPWLRADRRLDPYWDGLWGSSSGASWIDAATARRQRDAGLARMPKALAMTEEVARERLFGAGVRRDHDAWEDRMAYLGSLFSWRTLSAEQAAAMTGIANLAHPTRDLASVGFASGLAEMGVFGAGLISTSLASRSAAYRPARSGIFDKHIAEHLTWPEAISITGGQAWATGTGYDRHNMLAAELALRACEYTSIGTTGTVYGERFSTLDMLAGTGVGAPEITGAQATADLTLVRGDGLRIAVEMTANTGTHFLSKVRRWAKLLEERPLETSGLVVLFVLIERPERRRSSSARAETYKAIATALREHPGTRHNRVAERIAVATWREWFPTGHAMHPAFTTLRADRPTGRASAEDSLSRWERVDLLDADPNHEQALPFRPADPAAMRAAVANSALLGQTPRWVRMRILTDPDTRPTPLWPTLLTDLGRTHEAPVPDPAPARENRPQRRARLSMETITPPARLLGALAWPQAD